VHPHALDGVKKSCRVRQRAVAARLSGAVFCFMIAGVLLWSTPALALSQRGHVFASSFKGEGECQLANPGGVAVNESTGDVYVVDRAHERVDQFGPDGKCLSRFKAKVGSPEAIAVDNSASHGSASPSAGDVYVVSEEGVIFKFSEGGALIRKLKGFTPPGEPTEEFFEIHGAGVDAKGDLWVYEPERILHLSGEASQNKFIEKVEVGLNCGETRGFAVAPNDESFYVGRQPEAAEGCEEEGFPPTVIAKLSSSGETVIGALDRENTTAVAVDPSSGDVYIDNVSTVAALSSTGALIQRLGSEHLSKGSGIAVNAKTGAVYVAESAEDQVDIFTLEGPGAPRVDGVSSQNLDPTSAELKAQIDPHGEDTHYHFQYGTVDCAASPSSCTDVPMPPGDIGEGFGDASASVQLHDLQPSTTYYYLAIAENADGKAEEAARVHTFTTLSSPLDLLPDHRAWEMVSPPEKDGASIEAIDGTAFNSAPAHGDIQASEDGSAITYVADAPVETNPGGSRSTEATQVISTREPEQGRWSSQDIVTPHEHAEGIQVGTRPEYQFFSPDLSLGLVEPVGFTTVEEPPLSTKATEKTIYIRDNTTCKTAPTACYWPLVTAESNTAEPKTSFGTHLKFLAATPDLSHVVFESSVALTPSSPSEGGLYEWLAGKAPSEQVQLIAGPGAIVGGPEGGGASGESNVDHAMSNDGSRVFWTREEVTGEATSAARLYISDTAKGETVQVNAAQGVKEPAEAPKSVHFQTASNDGSRVLFTDTVSLTTESTLEPIPQAGEANPADLYACEVVEVEQTKKDGCKLTDLTVDHNFRESADVQGRVLGASEDGSHFYFVANGVLAPGATPGHCRGEAHPEATCNLYMVHYNGEPGKGKWEEPTFIATLSGEDLNDWAGGKDSAFLTARAPPNGRYLAFMSDRSLTGYNNIDANESTGKHADEEVFLYDAVTERLVCASCNPSGARPVGVFDKFPIGPLVDPESVWPNRWLAGSIPGWTELARNVAYHQSRYLSDEGRLFFNSADALAPNEQDKNGKEDVYEYEPEGVGSCERSAGCVALISSGKSDHESAFLDASVSGNDVFFLTSEALLPQDHDTDFDVYDARVCTEASPCLTPQPTPPPPCRGESCKSPPSSRQGFEAPLSAIFSGPGNIPRQGALPSKTTKPLTRAQKLARALKACRKLKKQKRSACARQARRKFGAKRFSRRSSSAKGKK
jgi:DNA-binding beta-propeller fold protein YncE